MDRLALLAVASAVAARPLAAQRPLAPQPFPSYRVTLPRASFGQDSADRRAIPETYWAVGAVLGSTAGGVAGYLFARGFGADHPTVGGYVAGIAFFGGIGLVTGALIGGQFPKSP